MDETRLYIDETEQHEVDLDVPYDAYDTLAAEQSVVNIDVGNGTTVMTSPNGISWTQRSIANNNWSFLTVRS